MAVGIMVASFALVGYDSRGMNWWGSLTGKSLYPGLRLYYSPMLFIY